MLVLPQPLTVQHPPEVHVYSQRAIGATLQAWLREGESAVLRALHLDHESKSYMVE